MNEMKKRWWYNNDNNIDRIKTEKLDTIDKDNFDIEIKIRNTLYKT